VVGVLLELGVFLALKVHLDDDTWAAVHLGLGASPNLLALNASNAADATLVVRKLLHLSVFVLLATPGVRDARRIDVLKVGSLGQVDIPIFDGRITDFGPTVTVVVELVKLDLLSLVDQMALIALGHVHYLRLLPLQHDVGLGLDHRLIRPEFVSLKDGRLLHRLLRLVAQLLILLAHFLIADDDLRGRDRSALHAHFGFSAAGLLQVHHRRLVLPAGVDR
jgi:hypothetical protein